MTQQPLPPWEAMFRHIDQDIQRDPDWQARMKALEMQAAETEPYRSVAFFHHMTLIKPSATNEGARS